MAISARQPVLIVDDSRTIHMMLRTQLAGEPVELQSAYAGEEGLAQAISKPPQLILLDVEMPSPDGFEVCRLLKSNAATMAVPVIFLSGASSTADKIRGLDLGATDYVVKPFEPAELRARVRSALRMKYLVDLLGQKAMIDGLTGLWNRTYLNQQLTSELSRARRTGQPLGLIMADVDHFKSFNDQYGHAFGDEVLRTVSRLLQTTCRAEDVVCRYGGEEFAILTPGVDYVGTAQLAERLRATIEQSALSHRGNPVRLTASFGVAGSLPDAKDSIIECADQALYSAKRAGRNRVVIGPPHTLIEQN